MNQVTYGMIYLFDHKFSRELVRDDVRERIDCQSSYSGCSEVSCHTITDFEDEIASVRDLWPCCEGRLRQASVIYPILNTRIRTHFRCALEFLDMMM